MPSGTRRAGFNGTDNLTSLPDGSFQPDRPGISQAALFRNAQFPNGSMTIPEVGPTVRTESATASFKLTLPNISAGVPFLQRGFEPPDADLKLGPLYFKLRALEAAVLHSDNVNLTQDDPQSGTIAYVGMTIDVLAQLTENLRLATSVTLVYLPIENRAGIVGYGLGDFYNFGLAAGPLAHAQVTWDTEIGGWHVVFMDDFEVSQGYYSGDIRSNNVLFDGSLFGNDLQSRTGRYSLGPGGGPAFRTGNQGLNDNFDNFNNRDDVVVYSNTVSVTAERLDPGTILLRARVYHEDLWYNQGNRGLPSLREGATISLISERENMRFKPYFTYDIFRTDQPGSDQASDWQNIFRAGLAGPITDQLFLQAEVGYFFGGQADKGMLWNVTLDHTAGPYTHESLVYARAFNYFHNEINEGIGYNISQILGPKLQAQAYAYRLHMDDYFDGQHASNNETLLGLRLTCNAGPKTTIQLTGEYLSSDPSGTPGQEGSEGWIGRLDIGYNLTDTLLLHFVYQYQENDSQTIGLSYKENLFFLSLTKYFQ